MATTLKLFRFVQNAYRTIGIHPKHQPNRFFSRKFFFSLTMVLITSSYLGYFLLDSTNIGEYGQNFYRSISILNTIIDFFVTVWQMPAILQLIEMCETFIEKSKHEFSSIFVKVDLKAEFVFF